MSKSEKQKRLEELQSQPFLSDQEIEEFERLSEEQQLATEEAKPIQEEPIVKSTQKRTLIEYTIDKIREKKGLPPKQRTPGNDILSKVAKKVFRKEDPATWDEIQQLKLDAIRARLKKDIAISKAKQRELRNERLSNILGTVGLSGNKPTSTKSKSKSKDKEPAEDFRNLIGKKTAKDYEGLI